MSGHISNKPKLSAVDDNTHPSPIILVCAKFKPDVRLFIFQEEFHVHSRQLEIYSTWFREKFKWAETYAQVGARSGSDSTLVNQTKFSRIYAGSYPFKYTLFTKVDADGEGWMLTTEVPENHQAYLKSLKSCGNSSQHLPAFSNLLSAIYDLDYDISWPEELATMTELADYYGVLPRLSKSLDRFLMKNGTDFEIEIESEAGQLLGIAKQLRNALLFRECLVWLAGAAGGHQDYGVNSGRFTMIADPILRQYIRSAQQGILLKESRVMAGLMKALQHKYQSTADNNEDNDNDKDSDEEKVKVPFDSELMRFAPGPKNMRITFEKWILRDVEDAIGNEHQYSELYNDMKDLLQSNLVIYQVDCYQRVSEAGLKYNENQYFCTEIADEDLPWDVNETEW